MKRVLLPFLVLSLLLGGCEIARDPPGAKPEVADSETGGSAKGDESAS